MTGIPVHCGKPPCSGGSKWWSCAALVDFFLQIHTETREFGFVTVVKFLTEMGDQDSSEEEFPSHGKRKAGRQNLLTDDVSEGESDGAVDLEDDEEMEEDESGSDSGEEDSDEDDDSLDEEEDSGEEEEEGSESEEEEEDEDEQTEEDGQEDETVNGKANAPSDAVEEEESCPICLNEFELQEVGTPAACQHNFCIDCILEWSKNINSCPVDRQQFNTILVRTKLGGKVIKKLKVGDVNQFADVEEEEEEEDNTYCQVCRQPTNEDRMLLCDSCDAGYHMECLTPPLDAVPIEEWFCPQCAPPESSHEEEEEEAPQETLLPVLPVRRAIARTMASERVRARVSRVRAALSRAQPSGSRSVSRRGRGRSRSARGRSTSRSTSRGRGRGRRRGTTRRKTTRSRSTTTTRKRGTKKTTTTTGTTVKRRRRKKRRRKKRKVKRVVVKKETPSTVKSRLAERLSLGKPIQGSSVPSMKKASDKKADFVQKPLMVFGNPNDLHCFEDGEETFPEAAAVPVTSRYRRAHTLSKSALRSHRPVRRAVSIGIASELASSPTHATSDATLDVLGSIFAEQELLHLPSSDVRINRDGTLIYGRTDTNGTSSSHRGTVRVVPRGEDRPNRVTNGVPSNQTALGSPPESSTHTQSSAGTSSSDHNSQGSQQGGGGFSTSSVTSGSSTGNLGSSQGGQHPWGPLGNQGATSLTTSCLGNEPNRNPSDEEKEEQPPKRKSESTDSFKPRQDESDTSTEESGSRLFSQRQWKPIQINIKSSLPHTDTSPVQGSVRTDLPDGEEPQEGVAGIEDKLNTSSNSSGAEQEYNPFSPTASPVHGEEGSGSVEYNPFSPTPEEEDDDQTNPSPESETNNNLDGTSKEPWEVEDSNDMAVDTGGLDLEQAGTNSPGVDSLHIDLDNLSPQLDREEDDDDEPTLAEGTGEEEEMTAGEESIEDFQFEEELDEFPLQKSPETFAMAASPVTMEIPNTTETLNVEATQQTESKKAASTSKASKAVLDMFSGLSPDKEPSEGDMGENQKEKSAEADSKGEALYEDVLVLDSGDVNSGLELHDVENAEAEERQSQPVERRSDVKDDSAPAEVGKAELTLETIKNVSYFPSRVTHTERPTSQEGWDSSDEDTLDIRPLPNIMDLPKIPKIRQTVPTSREKEKTRDKSSSSKGKKRRRESTAEGHQKERTKEKKRDREKRKEAGEQSRKRKSDVHESEEDVSVSNSSRRKRMKAKRSSSRRQSREREKRRDESFRVDRSSSLEQEGEGRADRSHRSYRRHRQDSSSSLSLSSEEEVSPERTRRSKSKDRLRMRSQHSSAPSSKSKSKEDRERRKHHKDSRREKNDSDKSDWSRGSSRDRKKEEKKRDRKHEDGDRRSKERTSGKGREQRRSKEDSPQEYKKPKEKSPEYKREERLSEPPKSDSRTLAEKIAEKNEKLYNYGDHDYRKAKDEQKKEKAEKVKSGTLMEELRKVGKPRLQSTVRKVSNTEQEEDVLPFSSFLSPGGMDRDHRSRVEREGPRTPEYSKQKNGDQSQPGSKDEDSDEGDSATLSRFLVPGGMDKDHRGADQGQLSNSNSSSRDDPRVEKMSRTSGERSNLPVLEPLRPPEIKPQLTLPQSLLTVLGVLTAQKPNAGLPSGPASTGGGQHTVTIEATSPEDVEMRDVEESGRDDIDENIESSAVEMDIKEKMLEKLNRQERVAEEVKLALKPFYQAKKVDKQQYKEILKKSVIQVCHTKTGKIDPVKIRRLVRQYVEKYRAMEKYLAKKKGSTSSQSQPWYRQGRK